jgi:hypothetical protein
MYCGTQQNILRDRTKCIAGQNKVYCGTEQNVLRDTTKYIAGHNKIYCGTEQSVLQDRTKCIAGQNKVYCGTEQCGTQKTIENLKKTFQRLEFINLKKCFAYPKVVKTEQQFKVCKSVHCHTFQINQPTRWKNCSSFIT